MLSENVLSENKVPQERVVGSGDKVILEMPALH